MDDELYAVLEAMQQYGGSFVKALATTWQLADNENRAKLLATFPGLYARYKAMAQHA